MPFGATQAMWKTIALARTGDFTQNPSMSVIAMLRQVRWMIINDMQSRSESGYRQVHARLSSRFAPMYILGVVPLAAGLAMVLAHNRWSGGVATVVVTVIGWLSLAKGLLFLFLSPAGEANFFLADLRHQDLFYLYAGILMTIGLYLTYAGFMAQTRSRR